MFELLGVGLIILLGILGGKFSHRLNIPKVTGYMLTGLVVGPSVLGLISNSTLQSIHLINDIALGLILFAIGGEVELRHLKSMGKKIIYIAIAESFGAFILVYGITHLITGEWGIALVLGSISVATAPGVTLLVVREYRARGSLTDTLLAVVAINNILCMVLFRITFSIYEAAQGSEIFDLVIALLKEFSFSILIGGLIAAMITFWEQKIDDLSELLLVIIAGILLGIGLARDLGASPLMVCFIIGAVTNNLSMMHRLVYAELRQTETPFYIAFFVLSGASLHLSELPNLGLLGIAYLIARPLGKTLGAFFVGRKIDAAPEVYENLGMGLLPQAGVAIGMVLTIAETDPGLGKMIGTVILSSVIVYEGLGPFLTRLSLKRAKEIFLQE